jgi:prepilin-type N-terminal cleavage/methylation domain-containing protein
MQIERNTSSGQWLVASGPLKNAQAAASSTRASDLHPSSFSLPLSAPAPNRRRGFTLTELLVVIAIIAVLAAMVSVGVMRALDTAKQTRIKTEVDQLDAAFKSYREKYGSFPPSNMAGLAGPLQQHIARAFPRYDISQMGADLQAAGVDQKFRPDQSLVFWLRGFGPDPAHPFWVMQGGQPVQLNNGMLGSPVTVTPLFDFDKTRLGEVASVPAAGGGYFPYGMLPSYFPQGTKADITGAPYIYWFSGQYPNPVLPDPPTGMGTLIWNDGLMPFSQPVFTNAGPVIPYVHDVNTNGVVDTGESWANADSFQILSAGMDGKYGRLTYTRTDLRKLYPTGTSYDIIGLADDDNVTNFCGKSRLGDDKP